MPSMVILSATIKNYTLVNMQSVRMVGDVPYRRPWGECQCLCLQCFYIPVHWSYWGRGYIGFTPSVRLSICPAFCVHSVTPIVLNRLLPYYAQMITSMIGCVAHNKLWPWRIWSRSFSHDVAIKLLKYCTSCRVCSTAHIVLHGLFPYLVKMITSVGLTSVMTFDLHLYIQCHSSITLA